MLLAALYVPEGVNKFLEASRQKSVSLQLTEVTHPPGIRCD